MTAPGRFPVEPLARAAGITLGQYGGHQAGDEPTGLAALAELLERSHPWTKKLRRSGLTDAMADQAAARLGLTPVDIWPTEWNQLLELDLLPPAGRTNALKTTCPQGHPYTHTDAAGARRCRYCNTVAVRRFRQKISEPQVAQTITAQVVQLDLWSAA